MIENLQREDLNVVEEAEGYRVLMSEYSMTQEQVAARVGKSRSAVANAMRLLNLPEPIAKMLREGKLTAGHARAILKIKAEKKQLEAAQKISALGLSVRQAELLCKNMSAPRKADPVVSLKVDYVAECEKKLSKHLGRGVKLVSGKKKGRVELEYYDQEDLQVLIDALLKMKK